jgi:hypothetical protein
MTTHVKSFDDAYLAGCDHCSETLEWEWVGDELSFQATCGCMKQHVLTPVSADLEILTDDEINEDYEE